MRTETYGLGLLDFLGRASSSGVGAVRLGAAETDALEEELSWHERAACVSADPEAFFPSKDDPAAGAKRVCAGFPVRLDCLAESLLHDERWGIWGGLGGAERGRLRRYVVGESLGVVRRFVEQDDIRRGRRRAKHRW